MDISVVLPIYNERDNIVPLLDEYRGRADAPGQRVRDHCGRRRQSRRQHRILKKVAVERPHVKAVFFRRNSGQAAAFDAGFRDASGDFVVTMDADLQNDPEDIPLMRAKLDEGFDLVTGWRKERQDGAVLRKIPRGSPIR